jgi:hypothetical protein
MNFYYYCYFIFFYFFVLNSLDDAGRGVRKGKKNLQAGKAKIATVDEFAQRLQKAESRYSTLIYIPFLTCHLW